MTLSPAFKYKDWFPLTEKDTESKPKAKTLTSPITPSRTPDAPVSSPSSAPNNAAEMAKRLNLVHRGQGYYARSPNDRPTYKSSNKGTTLVPVPIDEPIPIKYDKKGGQPSSPVAATPQEPQISKPKPPSVGGDKLKAITSRAAERMKIYSSAIKKYIATGFKPAALITQNSTSAPQGTPESIMSEYVIMQGLITGATTREKFDKLKKELSAKDKIKLSDGWWDSSFNSIQRINSALDKTNLGTPISIEWEHDTELNFNHDKISADIIVTTSAGNRIGISLKKDKDVHFINAGFNEFLTKLTHSMPPDIRTGFETEVVGELKKIKNRGRVQFLRKLQNDPTAIAAMRRVPATKDKYYRPEIRSLLPVALEKIKNNQTPTVDEFKALERSLKLSNHKNKNTILASLTSSGMKSLDVVQKVLSNPQYQDSFKTALLENMHIPYILGVDDSSNPMGELTGLMEIYGTENISINNISLTSVLSTDAQEFAELQTAIENEQYNPLASLLNKRMGLSDRSKSLTKKTLYLERVKDGKPVYLPLSVIEIRSTKGAGGNLQLQMKPSAFWIAANKYGTMDMSEWEMIAEKNGWNMGVALRDIKTCRSEIEDIERNL